MIYNRINNYTGWGVFLIALVTYLLTMAPTASFWDCGEFIACSNELEVPHPPGAPFFLLLGRIFAMFAFGDVTQIAFMVNLLSVLCSAFTVLFTFWITTHLGRRIVLTKDKEPSTQQTLAIMAAGVVGGLACTFADSFWFNAVEAEVYAMSSFFTAVVVWLMFKWEDRADEPGNERYIILIAYLMGLSIGVHLLNLLTIPALAFVYYFRKYKPTPRGFLATGAVSVAILGIIQTAIILYTFDFAWTFEQIFSGIQYPNGASKSGMGLPVGTGLIVFFVLLFGGLTSAVIYSARKKMPLLNTALLSTVVIYIGFSSYLMIPIRSNANPPIDENNPDNTQTFLSYMKREQYGNRPLFRGPLYNAVPVDLEETGKEYILEPGASRYTEIGVKRQYVYRDIDNKLFPRMYEKGRYNMGPHAYTNYVKSAGQPNDPNDDKPTGIEDLTFFFDYQVIHMYWRYFMWNFAGKEGDIQDLGWESGLKFWKTSKMPDFMKNSPAKNHYYMLPFLLGVLGLGWQIANKSRDAVVIGLLFFFTGLAIIIYLNQYPSQPRERDYSFAGSFQTYAIWIGLGVIALYQLLATFIKPAAHYLAAGLGLVVPLLMGTQNWDDHSRAGNYVAPESAYNLLNSVAPNAVLFTNGDNDTFPLWYIQEVEGIRPDVRVLCLSYVNTDWYIDQMYQKVNESEPLPLSLKQKDYQGQANQSRAFGNRGKLPVSLPANGKALLDQGIIYSTDMPYIQSPMSWEVPTRGGQGNKYLELKDILILNLLENVAGNNWERPIYFANTVTPSSFLGLDPFLRLEGLAYRILPVKKPRKNDPYDPFSGDLDLERMRKNMTEVFKYTNLDNPQIYYDENIMRMLGNYHNTFYRLANGYLRENQDLLSEINLLRARNAGNPSVADSVAKVIAAHEQKIQENKVHAKEVMDFMETRFPSKVVTPDPYMIVRNGLIYDRLGEPAKRDELFEFGKIRALETLAYYSETKDFFPKNREFFFPLQMLQQHYSQTGETEKLDALTAEIQKLDPQLMR
ncbi:MAG: DUF2723 domain-containing protein [Bacteroidia bacterium]|nr:DUF2723 domain-containing protein [Bacteroidia bacterium]